MAKSGTMAPRRFFDVAIVRFIEKYLFQLASVYIKSAGS